MVSLEKLCRICSDELNEGGVGIFSSECMEQLVGEKIKRYLYFSVSIKDDLPKKVCSVCLKKLDNIHRFAKMAAEMQEKFRMLLTQEDVNKTKPKIKIRSFEELSRGPSKKEQLNFEDGDNDNAVNGDQNDSGMEGSEGVEMASFDVAVEEVGGDSSLDEVETAVVTGTSADRVQVKKEVSDETSADEDSCKDEKPNPSLLHSLLIKGKHELKSTMDIDHDYLQSFKAEEELPHSIKDEPEDPEDEDIAEEIEEDRLNQIIKEEMEDTDSEEDGSDMEITEMEVKVDPMLYFSNTSQSAIDLDDSQEAQEPPIKTKTYSNASTAAASSKTSAKSAHCEPPPLMTRAQQRVNPVIASLKLGKPYKCTVCPRSFITDIGLQNHLWSHLPKSRKAGASNVMLHKNVDLEDSQVYSSNGVLHTAHPSENIHLLKYVCPICGKKISTKGNLKVHLETHRPKGKYGCDICGRVFKTAANLYRHKDYHGGVQFPCNVCGRVYPTNSTLRAHSITHSNQRPHKCPLCSKTFKRNQDLKFHINQHTGARPYQCPYCPKAFASSGNCFSHRKRMHPMEVERDKERAAEIMG